LRVLDAKTPVIRAAEYGSVSVENCAVGTIAYSVRVHLESVGHCLARHAFDIFFLQDHQTRVAGIIGIGLLQGGAAGTQGSIGNQPYSDDPRNSGLVILEEKDIERV